MKKQFIFFIATFLCTSNSFAQVFKSSTGSNNNVEIVQSITQAADSSYLIAGYHTKNIQSTDTAFIVRLKKNGSLEWMKTIDIPDDDHPFTHCEAVKTTNAKPDGYIAIVDGEADASYLVRINNTGSVMWSKKFNENTGIAGTIRPAYDNTGKLTSFYMLMNAGRIILKLNTNGSILWQKTVAHPLASSSYRFRDLQVTSDGGCVVAGNIFIDGGGIRSLPVVFRFTSIGTLLFGRTFILTANNVANPELTGVTQTPVGFAITGAYIGWGNITFTINAVGSVVNWSKTFVADNSLGLILAGSSIINDAAGNLIIASGEWKTYRNGVILKLNAAGDQQYVKKIGDFGSFADIKLTHAGTYAAAGRSDLSAEGDIGVVNLSATGGVTASCRPTTPLITSSFTPFKLVGNPQFSIVNQNIISTDASIRTIDIIAEQSLCTSAPRGQDNIIGDNSMYALSVANDIAGMRIAVKLTATEANNKLYDAKLYDQSGQLLSSINLTANQTSYITMNNYHTGIYSVIVTEKTKPVAKGKVVWVR